MISVNLSLVYPIHVWHFQQNLLGFVFGYFPHQNVELFHYDDNSNGRDRFVQCLRKLTEIKILYFENFYVLIVMSYEINCKQSVFSLNPLSPSNHHGDLDLGFAWFLKLIPQLEIPGPKKRRCPFPDSNLLFRILNFQ